MTRTSIALSAVLAFIASNVLSTAYYMATATENTVAFARDVPRYELLTANHLVFAVALAWLYPRFIDHGSRATAGLRFGAMMGLVMFVPTGLVVRGIWTVDFDAIFLANCAFHIGCGAVLGWIVARVQGARSVAPQLSTVGS